jgi:hypothetical protein
MANDYIELRSKTGIYTATCAPNLAETVATYINAVDDVFPVLTSSFGVQPEMTKFTVEFVASGGYYAGGGRIALSADEPNLSRDRPACYDGGLVFETIHGFLEPLRFPPHGLRANIGKNRLDESFSTIIEIDFLSRVGANNAASCHKRGEGMGQLHYPLLSGLVEIYDLHGLGAFHRFFSYVDKVGKSRRLLLDAIAYGQDEKTPYTRGYMSRLGEIFEESAGVGVTDILLKYAAADYDGVGGVAS